MQENSRGFATSDGGGADDKLRAIVFFSSGFADESGLGLAFFGHAHPLGNEDFRVAEHQRLVLRFGNIHDDQTLMEIHLGGGQADARGGIHGFEHVLDLLRQRRIEHLDRRCLGAKTGVRVLKNLQARHDVLLDCC